MAEMTGLTPGQQVDAAVVKTELLTAEESDLATTASELQKCRELLRDIEGQCGILLLDKYPAELKARMQEQLALALSRRE